MKLTVKASKSYDVFIEQDFSLLESEIKKVTKGKKLLVVTDSTVDRLYNNKKLYFRDYEVHFYVFPAGEKSKNVETLIAILKELSLNYFTREDAIIAFGGGVVGDIAAFAASIYMRGITFINIPTTLLSAIDSSVGGKTAIDFNGLKNNIGSFYQPSLVFINISLFDTLSTNCITSGLGEAVKYAFLSKTIEPYLLHLATPEIVQTLVYKCLLIKKQIVEEDEFDTDKRFLLNLGHTIGHSIEALSDYTIPHGECVAAGIREVIKISAKYYALSDNQKNIMLALLNEVYVPKLDIYIQIELLRKIRLDKKANADGVKMVLLKGIGEPQIQFLTFEELDKMLRSY